MTTSSLSLPSPRRGARRLGGWACVLCALWANACALSTSLPLKTSDGGADVGDNDEPLASVGCEAPPDVTAEETCASCDGFDVCGAVEVARCETRQDANGAACRTCALSDTDILFDDCHDIAASSSFCIDTPVPTDAPVSDDAWFCHACVNEGLVVETRCDLPRDACREEAVLERSCRVCSLDDDVVQTTCDEALPIVPRECARYADDAGTCVDCWDDNNALISHQCTPTDAPLSCRRTVQVDGRSCWTCSDANGVDAVHQCDLLSESVQCDVLHLPSGDCTLCVDAANSPTYFSCVDRDGADRDVDACSFARADEAVPSSVLCMQCPLPDSQGVSERACMGEPVLTCTVAPYTEPSEGGVSGEPVPSECLQCSGVAGETDALCGSSLPPACDRGVTVDEQPCAVCRDVATDVVVYDDCE